MIQITNFFCSFHYCIDDLVALNICRICMNIQYDAICSRIQRCVCFAIACYKRISHINNWLLIFNREQIFKTSKQLNRILCVCVCVWKLLFNYFYCNVLKFDDKTIIIMSQNKYSMRFWLLEYNLALGQI